jgi:hypothetical protein
MSRYSLLVTLRVASVIVWLGACDRRPVRRTGVSADSTPAHSDEAPRDNASRGRREAYTA